MKKEKDLTVNFDDIAVQFRVGDEVRIPGSLLGDKVEKGETRDQRAFVYGVYPYHIVFQLAKSKQRVSFQPTTYKTFKKVSDAIYTPQTPKNLDEYYTMLGKTTKK